MIPDWQREYLLKILEACGKEPTTEYTDINWIEVICKLKGLEFLEVGQDCKVLFAEKAYKIERLK